MKKTYTGSCHCGAVRYEVDLDLEAGTGRCNCSICAKRRFWGAQSVPGDFRLLTGDDALADYQFGTCSVHHRFCKTCGVAPFGDGHIAEMGNFVSINIACLDEITPETLAVLPVRYSNGRDNSWWNQPEVTSYL